jgi:transducin (beta)-like 1
MIDGQFSNYLTLCRSKNAVVNLWDLPEPPLTSTDFAQSPGPLVRLEHFGNSDQGDVDSTSLHWNTEGTLVAIGSYDSVLRVFTAAGDLYFSHTQHKVTTAIILIAM